MTGGGVGRCRWSRNVSSRVWSSAEVDVGAGCLSSQRFIVSWKRSTLPQVVGWFGRLFFCVMPSRCELGFERVASAAAGRRTVTV